MANQPDSISESDRQWENKGYSLVVFNIHMQISRKE